ncbi:hypothetical protein [Marinococcus halotolerans]|uniref:hypothetical protein n=1 Tax=Marinococcus halotolerans TaxID=301092 RepID=UPI0012EC23ED|nr:hypothetical protein [Marinococcus halotolerans]
MHQNHSMDEQTCIVVDSLLSIELTLMLVSTTVFLQQLSNTIEGSYRLFRCKQNTRA